jgi:hypothetical protein
MDASATSPQTVARRSRWKFTLAGLLVTVMILGVVFCIAFSVVAKSRRQRQLVTVVQNEDDGLVVAYDHDFSNGMPGPEWLRDVVGDGFFFKPQMVFRYCGNGGSAMSDDGIAAISGLDSLKEVQLGTNSVNSSQFRRLISLHQLEGLSLSGTWTTDEKLEKQRVIRTTMHWLSDDEVAQVAALPNLKNLEILQTAIGRRGIAAIATLRQIEVLNITSRRGNVDDEDVGRLATLSNLTELTFDAPHLSDRGLLQLGSLKQLKSLIVIGISPFEATLARLRAAIPGLDLSCRPDDDPPLEDFHDYPMDGAGGFGGGGSGSVGGFGGDGGAF